MLARPRGEVDVCLARIYGYEGLSLRQIAAKTELSSSTVVRSLNRSRIVNVC